MDRAIDRLEIVNLIATYSHTVDGDDPVAYGSVFTEDGLLRIEIGQPNETSVVGRAALVAFARREMEGRGGQPRHHIRNTTFLELTTDRARTRTYYLQTIAEPGRPAAAVGTGVFEDDLLRTAQGWRFRERRMIPDPPPPAVH